MTQVAAKPKRELKFPISSRAIFLACVRTYPTDPGMRPEGVREGSCYFCA